MMPYSDVVLEVVFFEPTEDRVSVQDEAGLLDALQRNVPKVFLNNSIKMKADVCSEFHVPSGTTLYLFRDLDIYEYVTMVVDQGAVIYNGHHIYTFSTYDPDNEYPDGVLVNNGTIYN